ncbi:hypothetical protein CEXT_291921 [Caerostris extrusa]|uniref:Uncharacterized protein n=1 Tax=Caerostris extrusa TaxID=172846 RepID=A0AAV4X0C7_CAEEX|nr:hypothetical protein CEXT_291921 [Caerostris extrusa]
MNCETNGPRTGISGTDFKEGQVSPRVADPLIKDEMIFNPFLSNIFFSIISLSHRHLRMINWTRRYLSYANPSSNKSNNILWQLARKPTVTVLHSTPELKSQFLSGREGIIP